MRVTTLSIEKEVPMSKSDALAERLRLGREARGITPKTRTYKKRAVPKISQAKQDDLLLNVLICQEAKQEADLHLDTVIYEASKAGVSPNLIATTLGLKSHGSIYARLERIEKDMKAGRKLEKTILDVPMNVEEV